jgi:hypothetical protein
LLHAASGQASTGTQPALPRPFEQVSPLNAESGAIGLHDDRLAWATRTPTSTDINLTNLTTGKTTTLSSTPRAGVKSLDFDGRWVVWSDNRFGHYNVFAVDTRDGRFTRLTDTLSDDSAVTVDGGAVFWLRGSYLFGMDIPTGKPLYLTNYQGQSYTPTARDGYLVWSQSDGDSRYLVVHPIGGASADRVVRDPNTRFYTYDPWTGEGRVVWEQRFTANPRVDQPPVRVFSVIQMMDLATGQLTNLTGHGLFDQPSLGPGRAAWIDETGRTPHMAVLELATGKTWSLDGPSVKGLLSDSYLVVPGDSEGRVPLYAVSWASLTHWDWTPYAWGLAAAIAVGGTPFLLLRRRKRLA